MRAYRLKTFAWLGLVLSLAWLRMSLSIPLQAQTPAQPSPAVFNLDRERELSVPIDGLWRFQTGDDIDGAKGWASPGFDDSHWPLIRADRNWSEQGYKNYGGSAWYRAKLQIPAGGSALALFVPPFRGSYQVFADGVLLATQGGLPPNAYPITSSPRVISLPSANPKAHMLQLAFRLWNWPHWSMYNRGGIARSDGFGLLAGDAQLIAAREADYKVEIERRDAADEFLSVLQFLAALASLLLFLFAGREREYLWFGLLLLIEVALHQLILYHHFHSVPVVWRELSNNYLANAGRLLQILFYSRLLGGNRDRFFWAAIGAVAGIALIFIPANFPQDSPLISVAVWLMLQQIFDLIFCIWLVNLLLRRAIQGQPDARFLLAPVLLNQFIRTVDGVFEVAFRFDWIPTLPAWVSFSVAWPFPMGLYDIVDIFFLAAMLAILLHRFTRTRRLEDVHHREREAARTVQQIIVADTEPATPGFSVQSVYNPFGEVGGDFFQVIPVEAGPHAGSVLLVIGDVSGKGLPAAMTVSLLVGTLRTLAHYTQSPGEILAAMNRRMLGRNNGGFTTCLALRAGKDGVITFANAGHIAPYLNGTELLLENGFPLGLTESAEYPESTFYLEAGTQLTLVTDGVVEARPPHGELYGFERTRAISFQSAQAIAQAAQSHGQDDDITVLTLTRLNPGENVPLAHAASAFSDS